MLNPSHTRTFNAYAEIIEEVDEMFRALDQYRKLHRAKKEQEAKKQLFKAHSHEQQARKLMNREYAHQKEESHNQNKAA